MTATVQDVIAIAIGIALHSGADVEKTAVEAAKAFAAAEAAYEAFGQKQKSNTFGCSSAGVGGEKLTSISEQQAIDP